MQTTRPEQQRSILAIALDTPVADSAKQEREPKEIRSIAESLGTETGAPDLARLYQGVLLRRLSLDCATTALRGPGERQLAYEMAVCVCNADGRQSEAERRSLDKLKALLKLDAVQTEVIEGEADAIADLSEAAAPAVTTGAATAMAFSFATTYALGQLSKRYYSGGRMMNTAVLRDTFQNLLGPAKQMQTRYLPQIWQQAETLDMGRVMAMVRGG